MFYNGDLLPYYLSVWQIVEQFLTFCKKATLHV